MEEIAANILEVMKDINAPGAIQVFYLISLCSVLLTSINYRII